MAVYQITDRSVVYLKDVYTSRQHFPVTDL